MPRNNESLGQFLLKAPWWVSAILGVLGFVALRWLVPVWAGNDSLRQAFAKGVVPLSPLSLIFFGIFSAGSYWFAKHRARLLESQVGLESLKAISWKEFEYLLAEAFRRQGYHVEFSLKQGADGGVDLILRRGGWTSLVQCKQWKTFRVGVSVIREMFGIMTSDRADEAIIVTTGTFTAEAKSFAEGKPLRLIDGPQVLSMVRSVQSRTNLETIQSNLAQTKDQTPPCPICSQPMVKRTARRGQNTGNQFWGCASYPKCTGTLEIKKLPVSAE